MRKIVLSAVVIVVTLSCIIPTNVSAVINETKERREIIIKYRDESELTSSKAKDSVKLKNKPQKLARKKIVDTGNSKLEIVETGDNDNIKDIAEKLSKEPGVEYAVPNHKISLSKPKMIKPKDPSFNLQWGLSNNGQVINGQKGKNGIDINVLKAWAITKGSPNVVVGVLDTGIDINHEDLKKNIFINKREVANNGKDDDKNGYIADLNGWDSINDDKSVYDSSEADAHGTFVAGIIAAENHNLGICGVAPNVQILPLKFIGENDGFVSDAIEAIEYGKKMGVKIFNCSWSMFEYNEALELEMKNSDAVFICAAGNFSSNLSAIPVYPACFNLPNIISVGAIDNRGYLA